VRTERTPCAQQQVTSAGQITKLGHGDAAQCQRRRILAQGHEGERAENIPRGEGPCGSGDEGIHRHRLPNRCRACTRWLGAAYKQSVSPS
jgi:hypothetical protein